MKIAPLPTNEEDRIEELNSYKVLDTLPEQEYDDITKIASHICNTPIALISLVDPSRQWFKAKVGLDAEETPRDVAFCAHAILQDDVFIINDSFKDERFHDNPLATQAPNVRFYAGAPLKTPQGNNIGTLCVIDSSPRDLTPEQIESLQSLSRQVISLLELRKAQTEVKTQLETQARFFANISHEIRTPMNAVLSCANLLKDSIKEDRNVKLINTISSSGDSLLTLINDILDFSKLRLGHIELEKGNFNLLEAAEEIVDLLQARAQQSNVQISLNFDNDLPDQFIGDVTRLKQVLTNLLSNAIKFTKDSIEINIKKLNQEKSHVSVEITVKDNGIGISQKNQSKLFKEFSQVDASTTRKYGGTGLGLSICKGLVEAMGGEISVQSDEGSGACFKASLDLEVSSAPKVKKIQSEIKVDPNMYKAYPLRILLAEDNSVNQMVAREFIARLGYRIDMVANGLEAVEALKNHEYDLVLMDQHMPEMDGVEATQQIRNLNIPQPYIVALTASVFEEDRTRCLAAGMDEFLAKPIVLPQVIEVFKKIPSLKRKKSS